MPKLDRLRALQQKVPVLNQEAASRIRGGAGMQLQQQAAQAPQGAGVRAAQTLAPQVAAQQGAAQLQQNAQAQQMQSQIGQQALQAQGAEASQNIQAQQIAQQERQAGQQMGQQMQLTREERLAKKTLSEESIASARRLSKLGIQTDDRLSFLSRKQQQDLAALGSDVKQKLFDSRLQFERDEIGRIFSNERQMADFAVASAKSQQELQSKMQTMEQSYNKEIYMMEQANKKITEALRRGYLDNKRELDQKQRATLAEMKRQMDKKIQDKKNKAANTKMLIGGAMMAGGAVLIASGAGAPAGGALIAGGAQTATSG